MPVPLAAGILRFALLYLVVGVALLPWLYRKAWPGAAPGAYGATWGFRILALPGTLLLWPVLTYRKSHPATTTGDDPAMLRRAQLVIVAAAALLVVLALGIAITTRHRPPTMDPLPDLGTPR